MKKIFNILMAAAITLGTFTNCEDVPMPFNNPLDYLKPDTADVTIEPVGDGTKANPFNVAGVLVYLNELGPDVESTKDIYVTGVVTSVKEAFSTQYGNAQFVISDTDEGTNQFTFYRGLYIGNKKYNNENDMNIEENDVVVICGKIVNYRGSTPETVQNKAYVVSINGIGEEPAPKPTGGEPKGSGTLADPYNATAANAYIATLASGAESDKDIYVKGKIIDIEEKNQFNTTYGNATFYISDDGKDESDKFYVFRTLYLGNKKYTEGELPKKGDEVIICGRVVNYMGNTPETSANKSYIYSINGKTGDGGGGGGTPTGDVGSIDNPKTVTEAVTIINGLEDDATTNESYYVKGKITKIITAEDKIAQYKNIDYMISDGTNEIQVFRGKNLDNTDFTAAGQINVGDEVIVYGKLQKYMKNCEVVPEIAKDNYIVKLTKADNGGGGNTPSPSTQGTKENPYNIADALAAINALADNGYSDSEVYVKGKVVKVTTNQANFEKYGNLNYLISEDGNEGTTITVYSGDGLNGAKFSGIDALNQGDEVIVYGKLQKYVKNDNVTPEIAKGNYLVSLNGKTE